MSHHWSKEKGLWQNWSNKIERERNKEQEKKNKKKRKVQTERTEEKQGKRNKEKHFCIFVHQSYIHAKISCYSKSVTRHPSKLQKRYIPIQDHMTVLRVSISTSDSIFLQNHEKRSGFFFKCSLFLEKWKWFFILNIWP